MHYKRQQVLLAICDALDCGMDLFIDPTTGIPREGFKDILFARMQKVGIYSMNELEHIINSIAPSSSTSQSLSGRIGYYDKVFAKETRRLEEFRRKISE